MPYLLIRLVLLALLLLSFDAKADSIVSGIGTNTTSPLPAGSCIYVDQGATTDTKLCSGWAAAFGAMIGTNNLSEITNTTTARSSLGLGTAATQNTGTSGATIPLLNGANTWSATQTLSGANLALGTNSITGNFIVSGTPKFTGLAVGSQTVCLGLDSLGNLVTNSTACGTGTGGGGVMFAGSFAGSANSYTMASPTPSGFTLTNGFTVCGITNVTNTGATTWTINSTTATQVEVQNSAGLQPFGGGEMGPPGSWICGAYSASANAFIKTTSLEGHVTPGATSQTISALQWTTGEAFVPAAGQTFTLPNSSVTLLSANGSVGFFAGTATTLQASGSDTITSNGATTAGGGSITIPAGSLAIVTGTGLSPTNFTVAILYPPVATASVVGLTKLYNAPMSAGWLSGANPDGGIMVAKTQVAMTITAIEFNATALAGGAATGDIYDIASGTASCSSGTKVTTSSFNANTSAGTPQDLLASPYSLSVGHSLCISAPTWPGSPTSVGTLTAYGAPS